MLLTAPDSRELRLIALENVDSIRVPPRSATVGIFGSVFNGASYLCAPGRTLEDSLFLAAGPTRRTDLGSVFVMRSNGMMLGRLQQRGGCFDPGGSFASNVALPGAAIFEPEEMNNTPFIQNADDWTQTLHQYGGGLAAILTTTR